jgi:isocitrate dehydrogenase kinase/phosphatase
MKAAGRDVAWIVGEAFAGYREAFHGFTSRARDHFAAADWHAAARISGQRLDLYGACLAQALERLEPRLGDGFHAREGWRAANEAYRRHLASLPDPELAETFFNSVTRRVFATTGVDPEVEFVHTLAAEPLPERFDRVARVCRRRHDTAGLVARLLDHHAFACGYEDLARDATRVAHDLDAAASSPVAAIESARALFYRGKAAYLVGRVQRTSGASHPLVIALANLRGRVSVDAVLLTEDEASIVFSFTRSYFFVEADRSREMVGFLRSLMPRKPVGELYDAIGHPRHGKTELYRSLLDHLQRSDDRFETAPGQKGMVMLVFALPAYDLVFKLIRDEFPPPKATTRRQVMRKYDLVFRHDRAGRLVDAREFEHLEFDRARFAPGVLEELDRDARKSAEVRGGKVVLHHLYTERRLRPLDLYLREAGEEEARVAIVDYGESIRDLARSNIFPGDMLLKNFGVTRHGRVVFYDYDELAVLTDCRFREVPRARYEEEEMAGEPWFFVGENDVFPEEFLPFLGLGDEARSAFLAQHADLLTVDFWAGMQEQHRAGHVPDIFPYPQWKRFCARFAS